MRFDIVTIFPGFFESVFAQGIVRRAQTEGLVEIRLITTPRQAAERADYNGRQVPRYTT